MYRKMDITIRRNCACIQLAFSAYMTQLTKKQSAAFERAQNVGIGTTLRFYVYFVFVHDFCL
jgi:hypothetical protein